MGKHTDAVKPLDEFRAPWETESGDEAEIDKPKLKRWVHNLLRDKAQAQDARDEALEKVTAAEADRDKAIDEAKKTLPEDAQKTIEKLTAANADLKSQVDGFKKRDEIAELRKDVLGDFVNDPRAKYISGETQDELEKSFAEFKGTFGISDEPGDDDETNPLRTRPRAGLRNPADKGRDGGDDDFDADKIAAQVMEGRGSVFG